MGTSQVRDGKGGPPTYPVYTITNPLVNAGGKSVHLGGHTLTQHPIHLRSCALILVGMEPNQVEPLGCGSVRCATLEGFRVWRQQWQPRGGREPTG